MNNQASEQTFEEALQRLEQIVAELENNETALENCIRSYEEGVTIAQRCLEQLERAELRVRELRIDRDDNND